VAEVVVVLCCLAPRRLLPGVGHGVDALSLGLILRVRANGVPFSVAPFLLTSCLCFISGRFCIFLLVLGLVRVLRALYFRIKGAYIRIVDSSTLDASPFRG
jgi:hypothetical protein